MPAPSVSEQQAARSNAYAAVGLPAINALISLTCSSEAVSWAVFDTTSALPVKGCCDFVQPDVNWCGGMSELLKISALADSHGALVVPHGSSVYSYRMTADPSAERGMPRVMAWADLARVLQREAARAGAVFRYDTRVIDAGETIGGARVRLAGGDSVGADAVVGADGCVRRCGRASIPMPPRHASWGGARCTASPPSRRSSLRRRRRAEAVVPLGMSEPRPAHVPARFARWVRDRVRALRRRKLLDIDGNWALDHHIDWNQRKR